VVFEDALLTNLVYAYKPAGGAFALTIIDSNEPGTHPALVVDAVQGERGDVDAMNTRESRAQAAADGGEAAPAPHGGRSCPGTREQRSMPAGAGWEARGHTVFVAEAEGGGSGLVVWCGKCGSHGKSVSAARLLAQFCPGPAAAGARAHGLARLARGRHPIDPNLLLGRARTLEDPGRSGSGEAGGGENGLGSGSLAPAVSAPEERLSPVREEGVVDGPPFSP
jgi:hypothetical protein